VLFEGALSAETAHDGLAARGYATRHLPGQGLPNALRITVGTAEQMDEVVAALRDMTGGTA
jgi:histidinol-phosphate aminotransferase